MSATTAQPAQPAQPVPTDQGTLDLSGTKKIGFLTLVRVELRKAVDTRAGLWLLITTGLFAALGMGILLAVGLTEDLTLQFGTFFATTSYTTGVLLPVLGILLVTSEWSQRTAMVTFTTEPRRMLVVLAKLVAGLVLALVVAVAATAIAAVCNLLYGVISGDPVSWSLGSVSVVGFLVTQGIAMLAGFALATIMLSTPAAIVLFFVYTFVLPAVFALGSAFVGWIQDIQPWLDFSSAQQPLIDWSLTGEDWAHLAVSGFIWLVLPLVLGLWRILRAEVK